MKKWAPVREKGWRGRDRECKANCPFEISMNQSRVSLVNGFFFAPFRKQCHTSCLLQNWKQTRKATSLEHNFSFFPALSLFSFVLTQWVLRRYIWGLIRKVRKSINKKKSTASYQLFGVADVVNVLLYITVCILVILGWEERGEKIAACRSSKPRPEIIPPKRTKAINPFPF